MTYRPMTYPRRSILVACAVALLIASPLRAANPATPAKPASAAGKPAASPVQPAIAALLKEYQTAMKDKKGEGLRDKCDYFSQNKTEGITPEVILAALEKPVSTDPRAEAYVKWQLLSGIEGKFPEELKARALRVYKNAQFLPYDHPGKNHADLQRKLQRIGIHNSDAEVPINKDMVEAINQFRLAIEPMLSYRDELYARMPGGFEALQMGLSDIYDRVSHGAPTTEFYTTVAATVRSWALASSDADHMRQFGGALMKIHSLVKDDKNKPYYRVMWIKEDNYTGLRWQGEGTIRNDKYIEELGTWLDEHAKNPGSSLNFKDSEDPKMKKK
jgi:hypothetical protein